MSRFVTPCYNTLAWYCFSARPQPSVYVSTDTLVMNQIRVTEARKRFLQAFDHYTNWGTNPHTLDNTAEYFGTQHRTINWCKRNGLVVAGGLPGTYVVAMAARKLFGLQERPNTENLLIRRRIRRRSSASAKM